VFRFEVLAVAKMLIVNFWVLMPLNFNPEDGRDTFL
jgi:hypothetical protein